MADLYKLRLPFFLPKPSAAWLKQLAIQMASNGSAGLFRLIGSHSIKLPRHVTIANDAPRHCFDIS
jgi:hypothetical protein